MAYRPSAGRNLKSAGAPTEPNLVPIMNLFITIIPFLLLMLVISQVALVSLNFSQGTGGGGGGAGGGDGKDTKKLQVIIMAADAPERGLFAGFEVREPGAESVKIPFANGLFNFVKLDETLKQIRANNPELFDIGVSPYPDVLYGPLIQTIDLCKNNNFVNVRYEPSTVKYY
ncbi:MAG: hypothetical protein Q8M98_02820 [Candidatus Cloacimonadaceae bacterium]|nr:hypothetical protein [Candidatus Cloacimonadaceae bacterium]MDP3113686.1 hypothetical protein [Candidatus Cloacimonadaceae bacterium]